MSEPTFHQKVEKQIHLLGASSSLASALVNKHRDFITSALQRGRDAAAVAKSLLSFHQQNSRA